MTAFCCEFISERVRVASLGDTSARRILLSLLDGAMSIPQT